jgi:hypothetical protein
MFGLFACKFLTTSENPSPAINLTVQPPPTSPIAPTTAAIGYPSPVVPQLTTTIRNVIPTLLMPTDTTIPTGTQSNNRSVRIFLIGIEDGGKSGKLIGCNDSAVPVIVKISFTKGVLKATLEHLLSLKDEYYDQSGLYNALYQSNLHLDNAKIENGEAMINLSGKILLGGECDNPRVEAQIKETALQFSTVKKVTVLINGKPLEEVLSLK